VFGPLLTSADILGYSLRDLGPGFLSGQWEHRLLQGVFSLLSSVESNFAHQLVAPSSPSERYKLAVDGLMDGARQPRIEGSLKPAIFLVRLA